MVVHAQVLVCISLVGLSCDIESFQLSSSEVSFLRCEHEVPFNILTTRTVLQ